MIKAEKPLLILNASRGGVDGSEGCFYYRIGLKTVPKEIEERIWFEFTVLLSVVIFIFSMFYGIYSEKIWFYL